MAEKQEKSSSKKADAKSKKGSKNGLLEFLADSRTRTILGLFFILLSAFLTLSFASYLIDGFTDQSQLQDMWEKVMNPEEKVNNWMGKLGAAIGHKFIYSWFGVAAFLFPFLLLLVGFQILFRKRLLPISKSLKHSSFFPLCTSYVNGLSVCRELPSFWSFGLSA